MLSASTRQDAEDVLQDVFVRAYGALRNDNREMNVRAWLYRVAHNRCIDHLRRPVPPPAEIFEVSRKPLHDPVEEAQRRDDLRQLVHDVGNLPEQQRSALLMREIDGMTYADLADALDVTVPAVKSLLVRARVGLVEAAEARDADCTEIRADLMRSYDRGVKASGRARKHMKTCDACAEYRGALRGMKRSFAALTPIGFAPFALAAKIIGVGSGAGGAAAGGAAAGGGVAACKVAAVVCTAAIATGGAVEVQRAVVHHSPAAPAKAEKETTKAKAAAKTAVAPPVVVKSASGPQLRTVSTAPVAAAAARRRAQAGEDRFAQAARGRRARSARRDQGARDRGRHHAGGRAGPAGRDRRHPRARTRPRSPRPPRWRRPRPRRPRRSRPPVPATPSTPGARHAAHR